MADYGQFQFDPIGFSYSDYMLEPDMHQIATAHPEIFLDEMSQIAQQGGWVAFGAERLVISVLEANLPQPAFGRIMDASLEFLHQQGIPWSRLNFYEQQWWLARNSSTGW